MLTLSTALAAGGGGHGSAPDAGHGAEAVGHAAEHASGGGNPLGLIVIVAVAYLLTHLFVNRLQRRFLFISGLEYLVLGVLLGPAVVNTMAVFDNLGRLAPIIAFAAGWIALLYGMEFKMRDLIDQARGLSTRLALVDVTGTGTLVGLAAYAFFTSGLLMEPIGFIEAAAAASMLACAAAAGSSSAVDLVAETYPDLPSRLLPLLRQSSRLGDMLAILGLGIVFCVFAWVPVEVVSHVAQAAGEHGEVAVVHHTVFTSNPSAWVLGTMGLGLGLGAVFGVFLGEESNDNNRFLAMFGITVFAAGASFFMNVSALTVNMLLGAWLVNTKDGPMVAETLETSLKPVTLVLLVFAGAMWQPVDPLAGLVCAVGYIAVRALAKVTSLYLASLGTPIPRDISRGLLAQGDVAVAIAVSFRLAYGGPAADLAYTAVLVSVMVHQLATPRLVKKLLIDAGELDSDATLRQSA